MERLAIETQTLYAELLERLTFLEAHRAIGRGLHAFIFRRTAAFLKM